MILMWPDNETDVDFLNFTSVASTVAEIIVQAEQKPISIGLSGAWGVGKSSMIKLARKALEARSDRKFLFVEFNAWLYQGYDDVRAALLEVIARAIKEEAQSQHTGVDKAANLLKRVNWLRVAKLGAGTAASMFFGLPPVGLIGEILSLGKTVAAGNVDPEAIKQMEKTGSEVLSEAAGLIRDRQNTSPPQEIQAIRTAFEEALSELGITLVVLIDDLDRCLPETTISALEAIRLFLFLKNTAFVIAADNGMIKHAVRSHFNFDGIDESYITSYFDKLIQVPIRVPPLGTQEVRAYLILLFVGSSKLSAEDKATIREKVCRQLGLSWKGLRVDRAFMDSLGMRFDTDTIARFDSAERLAPLMTTASDIRGNPRLIKRFLNALSIRMAISNAHDIGVDEAVLAKLLLFERCGDAEAYGLLMKAVNSSSEGKPTFLKEWEDEAVAGEELKLDKPWHDDFIKEWLALPPRIAERDLRGALYVSREHAPLITPEDRLSSVGAELLSALIEHPDMATDLKDRLGGLQRAELVVILDRLLERAGQIQDWGVPDILQACLTVTRVDPNQGVRLAGFLRDRPPGQITAAIVPKISGESWATSVFEKWSASGGVSKPVKKAIERRGTNGNL
jgi:predicted KAP-like P-loop ATPase